MLGVEELAKELKIHPKTVYNMVKRGMPVMRFGKLFRFDLEKVKTWLENNK
jgi:excisionase family DNA binding protein